MRISFGLVFIAIQLFFLASQLFWVRRLWPLAESSIPNKRWRQVLSVAAALLYLFLLAHNLFPRLNGSQGDRLTPQAVLFEAPFWWWILGSVVGFGVAVILWILDRGGQVIWGA